MDTTAAAHQAGITVATVRAWCRRNVIAAIKVAGRWIIDATSLARRIEIGREHMTDRYTVTETTRESYGRTYTSYTVTRTDGTPAGHLNGQDRRIRDLSFAARENAELACEFLNATPDQYRIERDTHPQRSIKAGRKFWRITGGTAGDPHPLRDTLDDSARLKDGTRPVDHMIGIAVHHAESAAARIREHADRQAVAAAEQQVREAREAQLAAIRDAKGPLATSRQVDYILDLLAQRRRTGDGGGFFQGPTDRAGIEELTKAEASSYITSLKEEY